MACTKRPLATPVHDTPSTTAPFRRVSGWMAAIHAADLSAAFEARGPVGLRDTDADIATPHED